MLIEIEEVMIQQSGDKISVGRAMRDINPEFIVSLSSITLPSNIMGRNKRPIPKEGTCIHLMGINVMVAQKRKEFKAWLKKAMKH